MCDVSQALFSQVPYYQAFDWEFIVDHQDRYHWFELQWIHMVESMYWQSVWSSTKSMIFRTWSLFPGITHIRILGTSGTGPDYYSELVPRVLGTWDT